MSRKSTPCKRDHHARRINRGRIWGQLFSWPTFYRYRLLVVERGWLLSIVAKELLPIYSFIIIIRFYRILEYIYKSKKKLRQNIVTKNHFIPLIWLVPKFKISLIFSQFFAVETHLFLIIWMTSLQRSWRNETSNEYISRNALTSLHVTVASNGSIINMN